MIGRKYENKTVYPKIENLKNRGLREYGSECWGRGEKGHVIVPKLILLLLCPHIPILALPFADQAFAAPP